MSKASVAAWSNPKQCSDCKEVLSGKEIEHGLEGFGHLMNVKGLFTAHHTLDGVKTSVA